MAPVEAVRTLEKSLIGGPGALGAALQAPAHDACPVLALGTWHRRGNQQLEDSGAQPSCHRAATFAGRDDADRGLAQVAEL